MLGGSGGVRKLCGAKLPTTATEHLTLPMHIPPTESYRKTRISADAQSNLEKNSEIFLRVSNRSFLSSTEPEGPQGPFSLSRTSPRIFG
eukprot:gene10735-biopygen15717